MIMIYLTICSKLQCLTFENCSFVVNEIEMNEENLCLKNLQMPLLLDLKSFKIINMPLPMAQMILRKCLNVVSIEIDGEIDLKDEDVLDILQENKMSKLKDLLIYSSR